MQHATRKTQAAPSSLPLGKAETNKQKDRSHQQQPVSLSTSQPAIPPNGIVASVKGFRGHVAVPG
jgi:hypothetical protein